MKNLVDNAETIKIVGIIKQNKESIGTTTGGIGYTNNLTKYDNVEDVENSVDNSKSIEELAKEVIAGRYGNGEERKQKLGSIYNEVQKRVNEILRGNIQKEEIYIVKKGDCLCNIAKKFNTTVEKIAKDNNITNVDLIYVNQKLIIR